MKKLRLTALLLTIALCVTMFAGCGAKIENANEDMAADEKADLTVYYLKDRYYLGTALGSFIYSHSKKYKIALTPFDSYEEMTSQLTEELAIGIGPDVVLLSESTDFDLYNALRNGQIADLSSYFAEDADFVSDNYYSSVLNGGNYMGGQYLVPFSFSIDTLCVEKAALERTGYKIDGLNDYYDLTSLIEALCAIADDDSVAFSMSHRRNTGIIDRYLANSGIDIVGTDGNVSDDMEHLKIVMELLAAMQDEYWKKETIWNEIKEGTTTAYEKALCVSDSGNHLLIRSGAPALLESTRNTEYISLPWKNINGQIQPILCDYGFVNQNSIHKEAAYDLLRYLMDYEIPFDFRYPLSIQKKQVEQNLYKLQHVKQFVSQVDGAEIHTLLIDEEEAEEITTMFEHMADAVWYNTGYYDITSAKMKSYIDTRDMDATLEELRTELDRYLHG